jgi:hypothetical protein
MVCMAALPVVLFALNYHGPGSTRSDLAILMGILGALLCYLFTLVNMQYGLAIMLFGIALSPEVFVDAYYNIGFQMSTRMSDYIMLIVLFAWLTHLITQRNPMQPTPLKGPLWGYILVAMGSTMFGEAFLGGVRGHSHIARFFVFFKHIQYYLLFLIVLNTIRTEWDVKKFAVLMILSSALSGAVGLSQAAGNAYRVSGPHGEGANIMAGFFIFNLLLAMGLYTGIRKPALKFALLFYIVVMNGIPMLRTLSRGAFAGMLVGALALGIFRDRRILFGLLLFMLILPFFASKDMSERLVSILGAIPFLNLQPTPPSWEGKMDAWGMFFPRYVMSSPLFGWGVGLLPLGYSDSEYLKILVETGLIGLCMFLWMVSRMLHMGWHCSWHGPSLFIRSFGIGYWAGVIGLATHGLAATTFTAIRTMEPLMFATGLMGVLYNITQRQHKIDSHTQREHRRRRLSSYPRQAPSEAAYR